MKIGYLFVLGFGMDFAELLVFPRKGGRNNAGRGMTNTSEKRKYKRLSIKLDLSYRKAGSAAEKFYTGHTVNVSPGGLYFETAAEAFEPGDLLRVELTIPPTVGLLQFGGRISGLARVLRTCSISESLPSARYGVALEFCRSPKLST